MNYNIDPFDENEIEESETPKEFSQLLPPAIKLKSRTVGLDIIGVIPTIPKDYNEWAEHDPIDYLDIEMKDLKQYLIDWLLKNKIDPSWLDMSRVSSMSLKPRTKSSETFIQVWVDNPNTHPFQDIRREHKEICQLREKDFNQVKQIIDELKNNNKNDA